MSLTASINTMPPEIVIGVFSFLLPKYLADLQLVCRTWRDIMYSMSHLWTTITVSQHSTIPMLDILKMATRQASRAGILPLTITWEPDLRKDDLTDEIKAALLDFFRNAPTSRWTELTLHDLSWFTEKTMCTKFSFLKELGVLASLIPDGIDVRPLQPIDHNSVSMENLRISDSREAVEPVTSNAFKRVGSMEDRGIGIVLPRNVVKPTALPLHLEGMQHLTHLTIERLELSPGFKLEMLTLRYLDVGATPPPKDTDTDITLRFPNLRQLNMPGNAPWLLAAIIAPKLQRLELHEVWTMRWQEGEELSEDEITECYEFLVASELFPSSVKTLILAYNLKAEVSSSMIKKAPQLRKLQLTVPGVAEALALFQLIFPSSTGNVILNTSGRIDWSACGRLSWLKLRMDRDVEPPQLKAQFEKMCRLTFILLSANAKLKRLTIAWPDGVERIMTEDEDTEQE